MQVDFREEVPYNDDAARALYERYATRWRGLPPGELPGLFDAGSYEVALGVFERTGYRKLARAIQQYAAGNPMAKRTVHCMDVPKDRKIALIVRFEETIEVRKRVVHVGDGTVRVEILYPEDAPADKTTSPAPRRPSMRRLGQR